MHIVYWSSGILDGTILTFDSGSWYAVNNRTFVLNSSVRLEINLIT